MTQAINIPAARYALYSGEVRVGDNLPYPTLREGDVIRFYEHDGSSRTGTYFDALVTSVESLDPNTLNPTPYITWKKIAYTGDSQLLSKLTDTKLGVVNRG